MNEIDYIDAQQRLQDFAAGFGPKGSNEYELMHNFAAHAALPVVLTAELLHLIRLNFFHDEDNAVSYDQEAAVLLSSFCRDFNHGLYEIDPPVRDLLLHRLTEKYGDERVRQLAALLWDYTRRRAPWRNLERLARAQEFTALYHLRPAAAEQWLASLENTTGDDATGLTDWCVAMRKEIAPREIPDSVLDAEKQARKDLSPARGRYLQQLILRCTTLPLVISGTDSALRLEQIYIEPDTTAVADDLRVKQPESGLYTFVKPVTVMTATVQSPRLVLTGEPGAGKTAFIHMLAAKQAHHLLGPGKEIPGIEADLLPVLIDARDLALRLDKAKHSRAAYLEAFLDQVHADLTSLGTEDFFEDLRKIVRGGRCLLIIDGLDAAPEPLRSAVREAVLALADACRICRVIVTCRTRAYAGEAVFPDYAQFTLAPFTEAHAYRFALAWHTALNAMGRIDAGKAELGAADLAAAIARDDLAGMAANPLLLTMLAVIHQQRDDLPRDRVHLSAAMVDLLLQRWRQPESGFDPNSPLARFLNNESRVREVLERLAFDVYNMDKTQTGGGMTLLQREWAIAYLTNLGEIDNPTLAGEFLDYIDRRSGLLVGLGGSPDQPQAYGFIHRILQEYLAGRFLVTQRNVGQHLLTLAQEGGFWNLPVILGLEYLCTNNMAWQAVELVQALCPTAPVGDTSAARTALLWAAAAVALIGREVIGRENGPTDGPVVLDYLDNRLRMLLSEGSSRERCLVGDTLGRYGDPRFYSAGIWHLPADDRLGFLEIPAGSFLMGSDSIRDTYARKEETPQRSVILSAYYLGRYPVTLAQFRAFVEATGFTVGDPACLRGLANYPVRFVAWEEAKAYCTWLNVRLHEWEKTRGPIFPAFAGQSWTVTLPTEAQWEKAARGAKDARRYPWGDAPVNRPYSPGDQLPTSAHAVGCFPDAASPYGVLDMLGNVSEWCADWYEAEYYWQAPSENPLGPAQEKDRVLRGGALQQMDLDDRLFRLAYRRHADPSTRADYIGFRCAVTGQPFNPATIHPTLPRQKGEPEVR